MSDNPYAPSTPIEQARANGYSWDEIGDHVAGSTAEAMAEGYTQGEVDQHLGYTDPSGFEQRSREQWTDRLAQNPDLLAKLSGPAPQLSLIHEDTADHYAQALANREVKGPQDFSDRYAAAALSAAHDTLGLDASDPNTASIRQQAGASAATELAAQLPADRDFTDASLSVGTQNYDATRRSFLDNWVQTGEHPIDAAAKADPGQYVFNPATATAEQRAFASGRAQPFYFVPGEELPDEKSVMGAIEDLGTDIATVTGLNLAGKYVVGPAIRAVARTAAEIPDWLAGLARKATTDVFDSTKPVGEAITQETVADAMKPAAPAPMVPTPEPIEGAVPPAEPVAPQVEPTASPAAKIARLTQLELDNRLDTGIVRPGLFQELAERHAVGDQATLALAEGHDTTASWLKWLGDVWHDESGAGPGITPPAEKVQAGSRRATILGKNAADELIRSQSTGLETQQSEALAHGFEGFYKNLAPFMTRWERELEKPYGGDAMNTEIGKLVDALEGNGVVAENSPFSGYARFRAQAHADNVAALSAAADRGEIDPVQLREYYISHLYTPESISNVQRGVSGGGRTGSLGFTRQRTIPTYGEAIQEGYKPKYTNPIHMDIAGIDAQRRALATLRMQAMARDANWMRFYTDPREAARDGFDRVFGLGTEKTASTVTPAGEPGMPITQRMYAQKGFAKIWNNWTQYEAFERNQSAKSIEDMLLKMKNASTYLKLMFPGYHTVTEYKEGLSNGLANVVDEISHGEIGRGIWDFAKTPIKPFEYAYKATKYREMYRAMEADPALDAFVSGGGTLGGRAKVYQASASPTIWKLYQRGELGRALTDDVRRILAYDYEGEGAKRFGVGALRGLNLPFREIGRVATSLTAPVWDHMIPLLKAGASIERIQTFLRQNPMANDDAIRTFARQVVTNIEDRMGEYNPANLFWNTTVKRAANQSMLSTGWTYGTIHATLAGLGYNMGRGFEWNPVATTNLAMQFAMLAMTNAAWSYLIDGKLPNSTLDYMIPFANARGIARVLLPGEEKEYYDWMKIIAQTISVGNDKGLGAALQQLSQGIGEYAKSKLAPIWQAAHDWLTGQDAIGHRIAYTPGGVAGWLKNEFLPIFATNAEQAAKSGINPVENLFGIRGAPTWLSNWTTWRQGQQSLHDRWTKEELSRARRENGFSPFASRNSRTAGFAGGPGKGEKQSDGSVRYYNGITLYPTHRGNGQDANGVITPRDSYDPNIVQPRGSAYSSSEQSELTPRQQAAADRRAIANGGAYAAHDLITPQQQTHQRQMVNAARAALRNAAPRSYIPRSRSSYRGQGRVNRGE